MPDIPNARRPTRPRGSTLVTVVLGTALAVGGGAATALAGNDPSPAPVGSAGPLGLAGPAVAVTPAAAPPAPVFTPLNVAGLATIPTGLAEWAPDGSRLAYVNGNVVTSVHPDGSGPVTVSSGLTVNAMSWSQRGARLALSARESAKAGDLPQLWITTPLGLKAYKVTAPGSTGRRTTGVTWIDGVTLLVSSTSTGSSVAKLSRVTLQDPNATTAPWVPSDPSAAAATTSLQDPAGSPSGLLVAYRQTVPDGAGGTLDSIWVAGRYGTGARKLTEAAHLGRPVWSADNRTVFVERIGAPTEVLPLPVSGAAAAPLVAALTGTPVLTRIPVSAGPVSAYRFTGAEQVATSVLASRALWPTIPAARGTSTAGAVVLANWRVWPDVAVAGPLAAAKQGPLLLTPAKLDWRVAREIKRILPAKATVYLVGSTIALPPATVTLLNRMGHPVVRYAGKDPYATAVTVALKGLNRPNRIVMASLTSWQDSFIASAAAGRLGAALMFTRGTKQAGSTLGYVNLLQPEGWAIGQPAATAAPWATATTGADAGATSLAVAQALFLPSSQAILATEAAAPDSMVAASVAARLQQPLLFTSPTALGAGLTGYLDGASGSVEAIWAFGRPAVPAGSVLSAAAALGAGRIG